VQDAYGIGGDSACANLTLNLMNLHLKGKASWRVGPSECTPGTLLPNASLLVFHIYTPCRVIMTHFLYHFETPE
jgi:hypothetical protein